MSKYYRVNDVSRAIVELPNAENGYSDSYDKAEILNALEDLPTIEVSEDSISRKGLIDSFLADNECDTREEAKACMCSLDFMLELIEDAPSVALSRAEGEWKYGDLGQAYDFPTCSKCGYEVEEETNYCPNCGAKMKGVEDE